MNNNTVKCIKVKIFPINQNECVYLLELPKLVLPSGVGNTPKIAISRICYGENGTVKFLETLPENVFRHNYSMAQIKKKKIDGKISRLPKPTPLSRNSCKLSQICKDMLY